jgi:hypothetical protein
MVESALISPHRNLDTFRHIRSYEAFRAHYLQLDPELADSPAFLQELLELGHGFDWLEALVEETLEERCSDGTLCRPQAA